MADDLKSGCCHEPIPMFHGNEYKQPLAILARLSQRHFVDRHTLAVRMIDHPSPCIKLRCAIAPALCEHRSLGVAASIRKLQQVTNGFPSRDSISRTI